MKILENWKFCKFRSFEIFEFWKIWKLGVLENWAIFSPQISQKKKTLKIIYRN